MKVLHLIDSAGLYGAEMMLLALAQAQQAEGITAEIGSIGAVGESPRPLELECARRGIPCRPLRFSPRFNVFAAWEILRALQDEGINLLHGHGFKPDVIFGMLLRHARKIPMLVTVHGWTETRRLSKMGLYQSLDMLSWLCVDKVVAVADSSPVYKMPGIRRKAVTIENGIYLPVLGGLQPELPMAQRIKSFCKGRPCIATVSRLSPEKGLDTMLAALAMLRDDGADYALVIVGEGPERGNIERHVVAERLQDQVLLTGYVDQAHRLMSSFDVLAMPSRTEGLPITLLEAMACGVPVIATRVGQVARVLEDGACGHLLDPEDAAALACGIRKLASNADYRDSLVRNARRRVEQDYSIEQTARMYCDVYRELAENGARSMGSD